MDSQIIAESDSSYGKGSFEHNELRFDNAAMHFWKAFVCLDELSDATERRDRTSELARRFQKAGYEDLSLLALRETISLDETLNDNKVAVIDLIYYGNIHTNLGNLEEAKSTFKKVIDLCLGTNDYANAASASTNLAVLLANNGDGEQAINLLINSLEYLSKAPFPDTEFNTHATLIQVVDIYEGEPQLSVKSGIALSQKFNDRLTAQHRQILAVPIRKAVEAFLEQEPQSNPDEWKKQNLPWVYSDTSV